MPSPDADAVLAQIESHGFTVSRAMVLESGDFRWRLAAWQTNLNPLGFYQNVGPLYHVSESDKLRAAEALARAVGLPPIEGV